ncbi:hypothetical protein N7485_009838 [Penicillium canescens]|nr:hypothetical protein N7485_009838 [Penicillium canescens]
MASRPESSRAAGLRESARRQESFYADPVDEPSSRKRKQAQGGVAPKSTKTSKEESKSLDTDWLESDLKNSYAGRVSDPAKTEPTLQRTQYMHQDPAITELSKVPAGWTRHEHDLHPDDYEAQVERCLERLEENIMPIYFETRLKELEEKWKDRDARMDVYPKLSWPVVQRLEVLAKILEWLGKEDETDEYQQVDNVKAIIRAYKDKTLDWNPDLVTYWSKGAQLCQPRPFKMDEFMHINVKHKGHTGFWVEGFNHVPEPEMLHVSATPGRLGKLVDIDFTVRFPSEGAWMNQQELELDFVDDTGAGTMTIYGADVRLLQDMHANSIIPVSLPPVLGVVVSVMADATQSFGLSRMLEVNIRDPNTNNMLVDQWTAVPCIVRGELGRYSARLSGPWMRRRLYTYTAPDNSHRLWIHQGRPLVRDMPRATVAQRTIPMPFNPASYAPLADHPHLNDIYPDGIPPPPPASPAP